MNEPIWCRKTGIKSFIGIWKNNNPKYYKQSPNQQRSFLITGRTFNDYLRSLYNRLEVRASQ